MSQFNVSEFYERVKGITSGVLKTKQEFMRIEDGYELDTPNRPVETTDVGLSERDVLQKHVSEIIDLILNGFEEKILFAAERGETNAILCVYKDGSRLRNVIPIHDLLFCRGSLLEKFKQYEISGILDVANSRVTPFRIAVDTVKPSKSSSASITNGIFCITAKW